MKTRCFLALIMIVSPVLILSCKTPPKQPEVKVDEHAEFLKPNPESEEVFHVLMSSDRYECVQMKGHDIMSRQNDPAGDAYFKKSVGKYDIISETRESRIKVSLWPSGKLQTIRPITITYLHELERLIMEDIQRWVFKFPKGSSRSIDQLQFEVKYRIVLQKRHSDQTIMKEIRQKMKEKKVRR